MTHPVSAPASDTRPHTAVLITYSGFGDLIWHLPYFERAAAGSRGGRVAVIAAPSTFASQLLAEAPWVEQVIEIDHRPRASEKRKGRHQGPLGLWRMSVELREHRFDRILLFSSRASRAAVAWLAGIPQRAGYGFDYWSRLWLNQPPYIRPYRGESVALYEHATAFAMAHGLCDRPLQPRVPPPAGIEAMALRLAGLPRPLVGLGIGTSLPVKQWGAERFTALASGLIERGAGVVVLGGPAEEALARQIEEALPPVQRMAVKVLCRETLVGTASAIHQTNACVGNDTGVAQLAAACGKPSFVLLGNRPALSHDPLIRMIRGPSLAAISAREVIDLLVADECWT